jgi:hypothetical protein
MIRRSSGLQPRSSLASTRNLIQKRAFELRSRHRPNQTHPGTTRIHPTPVRHAPSERGRPEATGGDRRRPEATGGDRRRPEATGGDRRPSRGKTRPFGFRTRTTQQSAPWPNCHNNRATAAVLSATCMPATTPPPLPQTAPERQYGGEQRRSTREARGVGQMRTPAECNTQRHRQQQQQRPQKKRKEDRKRRRRAEHFLRSRRGIQRGARSELRCVMDHIIEGWGWRPPRSQSS